MRRASVWGGSWTGAGGPEPGCSVAAAIAGTRKEQVIESAPARHGARRVRRAAVDIVEPQDIGEKIPIELAPLQVFASPSSSEVGEFRNGRADNATADD